MNIKRGLFRLWAALSLFWLCSWGIVASGEIPGAYRAAYVGITYEFKRPDSSRLLVVATNYNEAVAYSGRLEAGLDAPPCKNGKLDCEPHEREWDKFVKLLPGAILTSEGKIVGPVSVSNPFFLPKI